MPWSSHLRALQGDGQDLIGRLRSVEQMLEKITPVHAEAGALLERIRSCALNWTMLHKKPSSRPNPVDLDPAALSKAEADKDRINRLLDKHRVADFDGLSERLEAMRTQLLDAQHRDATARRFAQGSQNARHTLDETAVHAAPLPPRSGHMPCSQPLKATCNTSNVLCQESVSNGQSTTAPEASGPYRVSMSFAANPGQPLQPLTKVASGGERSRVMLSLKAALTAHLEVPTLILDEIDAGSVAMSRPAWPTSLLPFQSGPSHHHQPPAPSRWQRPTTTSGYSRKPATAGPHSPGPLDQEARVEELAAMLSGETIGDAARAQARSLMA